MLSTCEMFPRNGSRSISAGGTTPKATASGGSAPSASARKVRLREPRTCTAAQRSRGGRGNWPTDSCGSFWSSAGRRVVEEAEELRRLDLIGSRQIVARVRAAEGVEEDEPARSAEQRKRETARRRASRRHASPSASREKSTASPPAKFSPAMSMLDSLAVPLCNSTHVAAMSSTTSAGRSASRGARAIFSHAKRIHGA